MTSFIAFHADAGSLLMGARGGLSRHWLLRRRQRHGSARYLRLPKAGDALPVHTGKRQEK
jgi:hypothetical protein